jgi:two-component system OmpR family sensor kinase
MSWPDWLRDVTWRALWILAPLFFGAVALFLTALDWLPNPILYLRGELGTLALWAGALFSLMAAAFYLLWRRVARAYRRGVAHAQAQAAEERRRFLRRLDHEWKNPLTAIRAGLANLAEAPSEGARAEALGSVEAQALRLSRLAADLRKLAELETRPLECAPVDVGALLQEVVAVGRERPGAQDRRLHLTVPQAPWPLPEIEADGDLLFLALHNMVDNAIKFTAPGDTVEVRAFEDGTGVVIEVADTGPGIPEEELPHIWEELYRGQGARGVPGSGLGLALVRAIVERHGGTVALRSRPGQGTVLNVRLLA